MSADRDELRRLVDELPDEQVPSALADVRRRAARRAVRPWPPAWFGAAVARRTDTAARADELLGEGFGRPA
jgi:anti-sigma factor RsiW